MSREGLPIMAMSEADYRASHPDDPGDKNKGKKPWFTVNSSGVGYHPSSWQRVLVLAVAVAALVCVILLIKGVI